MAKGKNHKGRVRIIAGEWRGRKLPVPDLSGLRPSGDRVRETLFNWLRGEVEGARCLDLFAGSGALGLEAASRGGREVVMVEKSRRAMIHLREVIQALGADQIELVQSDAIRWLELQNPEPFDLVFLDPPFSAGLHGKALKGLLTRPWLKPGASVYIESPAREAVQAVLDELPELVLEKQKNLGEVRMQLLRFVSESPN